MRLVQRVSHLARFLLAADVDCVVAAPSKLQRPARDGVKTDKSDALHLARLLHLGEIVAVTIPDEATEAARDLVRAREDVRGELMSSRHRISKLLLRQGIVYSGGKAWTPKHETWLRGHRFDQPALQFAYDSSFEGMLMTVQRRNKLDEAIAVMACGQPVHAGRWLVGLVAWNLHIDRVRSRGRDRGLRRIGTGSGVMAAIKAW